MENELQHGKNGWTANPLATKRSNQSKRRTDENAYLSIPDTQFEAVASPIVEIKSIVLHFFSFSLESHRKTNFCIDRFEKHLVSFQDVTTENEKEI